MAGWSIRNYNAFVREAREEFGLSLDEARELYGEIRDWKVGPVVGADVDRYADALAEDPSMVVDSMLYGIHGAGPEPEPMYDTEDLDLEEVPEDYDEYWDLWLDEGAEIEYSAETYGDEE